MKFYLNKYYDIVYDGDDFSENQDRIEITPEEATVMLLGKMDEKLYYIQTYVEQIGNRL